MNVSIIMPVRNEVDFITKSVDSILDQDYDDGTIQIIIADGMSDDGTIDIIQNYKYLHENIIFINNPERTVSTAINRALTYAIGEIIIRVDGHCEIEKNYISKCIEILNKKTNVSCVGGAIKNISFGIVGNAVNIAQSSPFGVGGVMFRTGVSRGRYVDTLAFGAYHRSVFEEIGGCDEELVRNQDDEFNFRLIQSGGKIWLDPQIKSYYYPRTSIRKLFKQYFQYGYYKVRVIQKRKGVASFRHLVPGIFVLSLISSTILGIILNSLLLISIVIGPYVFANMIASTVECLKKRKSNLSIYSNLLIPFIFFTLHFSYGLGFLVGNVRFIFKWGDNVLRDTTFNKIKFLELSENSIS